MPIDWSTSLALVDSLLEDLMTTPTPPFVSICACTYKRSDLLLKLLTSLAQQNYPRSQFEILIADNDAAGSAQHVVGQFMTQYEDLRVRYEIEPEQGISFARNRTVRMAQGELLAFIDDDEHAVPHWLSDLVACQQQYNADAVMGPVLPIYPAATARWVVQSRFFERPRFETGTPLAWNETRAGNALVKASWAKQRSPHAFDPRLARIGGEDTDFFKWIERCGGKFFWCNSATVAEEVPLSRQSVGFILERSFRSSVTYWRAIYPQHSFAMRYREAGWGAVGGVSMLLLGLIRLPLGLGHATPVWAKAMKAFGRVAALSKIELVGYK